MGGAEQTVGLPEKVRAGFYRVHGLGFWLARSVSSANLREIKKTSSVNREKLKQKQDKDKERSG